jgi:hypothetical protein
MALGISSTTATSVLNALGNNTSFAVAQLYCKLHVGDPGAAGTSNPAGNTTRQSVSFGTAASAAMSNDTAITWTSVSTSEDYTHYSLWDSSTAGNFHQSGTITANAVTAGDTFTIPIGDLDLTWTGVAA